MIMAVDAQSLITQANCYLCAGRLTFSQAMKIALLAQISLLRNAANDVTPQGLITAATCYGCVGMSLGDMMEVALLKQIAT